MARLAYPSVYDPDAPNLGLAERHHRLLDAFYTQGSRVIDELAAIGALRSMQQPLFGEQVADVDWAIPEYHAEIPENKTPYGRTLLPDFDLMGGTLGGAEIVNQCAAYLAEHGVEILTDHRVTRLECDSSGAVVGVGVERDGATLGIGARRGVVFATGGFTHDREKALGYLRGPIFGGCAVPTNTGDFVDLAVTVGAELGNMSNAFWSQSALEPTIEHGMVDWDEDIFVPFGDSMVIVDKNGHRVGNEKMVYQERTQTHFTFDPVTGDYPNLVQMMIWDSAVAQYDQFHIYRYPVPEAGADSPYVVQGDTFAELATRIDERLDRLRNRVGVSGSIGPSVRLAPDFAANLEATVGRFNGFAETGVDLDFHRGETPIQLSWGSVPRPGEAQKNPTMRPFAPRGPYFCILLSGGTLDTCGGPVIDEWGRVLRPGGAPVGGLYGAGNCVASPTGQAYWSAGSTLGPGLTFGYLAGSTAAESRARDL